MNTIKADKNKDRARIAADTADFLKRGGKITEVGKTASAYQAEFRTDARGRKRFVIDLAKKRR